MTQVRYLRELNLYQITNRSHVRLTLKICSLVIYDFINLILNGYRNNQGSSLDVQHNFLSILQLDE